MFPVISLQVLSRRCHISPAPAATESKSSVGLKPILFPLSESSAAISRGAERNPSASCRSSGTLRPRDTPTRAPPSASTGGRVELLPLGVNYRAEQTFRPGENKRLTGHTGSLLLPTLRAVCCPRQQVVVASWSCLHFKLIIPKYGMNITTFFWT